MALNPLFLSLHALPGVQKKKLQQLRAFDALPRVPYHDVQSHKFLFLRDYFEEVGPTLIKAKGFQTFVDAHPWVETYALFKALKHLMQKNHWLTWPVELQYLKPEQFDTLIQKHWVDVCFYIFLQYLCYIQMKEVKRHAKKRGVFLKGDIPILISPDSADVWEYTDEFDLHFSAGAPPDVYTPEGQVWGLPIFKWGVMRERNYDWWKKRLAYASEFYDLYRIDHILGFFRIWAIPQGEPCSSGKFIPQDEALWLDHGKEILQILTAHTHMLPIGEDLGFVPDAVRIALTDLGICGTKVLRWERQKTKGHPFIGPLHYNPVSMSTVSTHDSSTLTLWWQEDEKESKPYAHYKGWDWGNHLSQSQRKEILWDSHHSSSLFHINLLGEYLALFPELVWSEPHQERINVPGTVSADNWTYRTRPTIEQIVNHQPLADAIKEILI
jgi:4-alpha-glucanotransferase